MRITSKRFGQNTGLPSAVGSEKNQEHLLKRFKHHDTKFQAGARLMQKVLNGVIIKMPLHSTWIRAAGGGLDELIVMMRPHFGGAG